jgi:hypothetical protein
LIKNKQGSQNFDRKNTQEFVEVLVSFDVEALYPSVPIPRALEQFKTWLKTLKLEEPLAAIYTNIYTTCSWDKWRTSLSTDGSSLESK